MRETNEHSIQDQNKLPDTVVHMLPPEVHSVEFLHEKGEATQYPDPFEEDPNNYEDSQEPFIGILPETPEQAQEGARNFEVFVSALPAELRNTFLDSIPLQACFIGVVAESGFWGSTLNRLTEDQLQDVRRILSQTTPHMRILQHEGRSDHISLVNLEAAQRTADHYQEQFHNISGSIENMIEHHPEEWVEDWSRTGIHDIRFGILSGFPLSSVLKYQDYRASSVIHMESNPLLQLYKNTPLKQRTPEMLTEVKDMLMKAGIEPKNQSLLLNAFTIPPTRGIQGYIGFFPHEDRQYVQQVNELVNQSGIDKIVTSLQLKKT